MRLVALIAIATVGACGHRDSPDDSVALRYRLVDGTTPARAHQALDELLEHRFPVAVRGDIVEVTFDSVDAAMVGGERIDEALRGPTQIEVRVVDYDSPYLNALARSLSRTPKLEITAAIDPMGRYLRVPDTSIYVNEAWAKAHHCDHAFYIEGTGYSCPVHPPDRLRALLSGDPLLFVDAPPAELATPADRAWVPARERDAWRYYLTFEPPILLDGTSIASVDREGIALTTRGASILDTRAHGSAIQLAVVTDKTLLPAQRDGARLRVTLDDRDASRIRRGLPFQGVHLQLAR